MGNRVSRITDGFSRRKKKETGHDPIAASTALTDRQYNTDLYIPQTPSDTAAKVPTPPSPTTPAGEPGRESLAELVNDEAMEDAAIKIQASYKGYKARKEVKELMSQEHAQEAEPVEAEPVEAEPVEAEPVEAEPVEAEKVEAEPVEAEPVEAEPVEAEPVEAEPGEAEPGEAEPAEAALIDVEQDTSPVSPNVTQVSNQESSQEQEIDIDLNDPEVEAAALKIQCGFRGYKKKKTEVGKEHSAAADTEEESGLKESLKDQQDAVETPPAAQPEDGEYTEMKTNERLPNQAEQTSKESQSNEKTNDNAENKEKAVEEDASSKKENEKVQNAETVPQTQGETEEVDIDLGDPDVAAAALKIQANFRGNILRKKKKVVEAKKREEAGDAGNGEQAAAPEEAAPE